MSSKIDKVIATFSVPYVTYSPSHKWYGRFSDLLDLERQPVPVVRYEPFVKPGQGYVVFSDVDIRAQKAVEIKQRGYIEHWERIVKLQAQRAAEARRAIALVEGAIETSRKILEVEENWDGEGSPAYSESNWKRATRFVREITVPFITQRKELAPPNISGGPDGSIDVRWTAERRTMLLNFPPDEAAPPDFFGHDRGHDSIKGTLDLTSHNQWLLLWLTR